MEAKSFDNLTVKEAAELLAVAHVRASHIKEAGDVFGPLKDLGNQARTGFNNLTQQIGSNIGKGSLGQIGSQISQGAQQAGNYISGMPAWGKGLALGAGLGALGGGLSSLARPKEERNTLQSALTGALGGGLLGGGAGLVLGGSGLGNRTGGGAGGGDRTDINNLDPETIKNMSPDELAKIRMNTPTQAQPGIDTDLSPEEFAALSQEQKQLARLNALERRQNELVGEAKSEATPLGMAPGVAAMPLGAAGAYGVGRLAENYQSRPRISDLIPGAEDLAGRGEKGSPNKQIFDTYDSDSMRRAGERVLRRNSTGRQRNPFSRLELAPNPQPTVGPPDPNAGLNDVARRSLQRGRDIRMQQRTPGFKGKATRYGIGMGLPLLINYLLNQRAQGQAAEQMQRQLAGGQ